MTRTIVAGLVFPPLFLVYRPPGMTITPALIADALLAISADFGFGSPSALRCLRVSGFTTGSGGGGVIGRGEDAGEDNGDEFDEPGADNSGVDSSAGSSISVTSRCSSSGLENGLSELRVRFATMSERDDPDDSSNDRLGER